MREGTEKPIPGGHLKKEDKDLLRKTGYGRAVNPQWIEPEEVARLKKLGAKSGEDGWLDVPRFNLNQYPVRQIPEIPPIQRGKRKLSKALDGDGEHKSGDRH
jgi:hypothetical protein